MPSLLEVQRSFRRAILAGDTTALAAVIAADGIVAAERIEVHRNNVVASLGDALAETFPVVCRLVDARFFAFAAHEFICVAPPDDPCVADYGARFADFLVDFPPCRELVYLADVARLEWLLQRAGAAADGTPLGPSDLAGLAAEDAERLTFRFQPSFGYLCSPWPIAEIWRANRTDDAVQAPVDLDSGGALLEVCRRDGVVEFREVAPATFAFRAALAGGAALGDAIGATPEDAGAFDIDGEFASLFAEGALAGFSLVGSA